MIVVIIGAHASGKMTIGQELEKITDLKLFHNHMSIDFVLEYMPMSPEAKTLIKKIRFDFFETIANSKTHPGIIFTFVADFNDDKDIKYLEDIQKIFDENNKKCVFIELNTSLEERLRRNKTENRLLHKKYKRDLKWSEQELLNASKTAQLVSKEPPNTLKNYHKLANTNISASDMAQTIKNIIEND